MARVHRTSVKSSQSSVSSSQGSHRREQRQRREPPHHSNSLRATSSNQPNSIQAIPRRGAATSVGYGGGGGLVNEFITSGPCVGCGTITSGSRLHIGWTCDNYPDC